jgi:hypothetical protein
MIQGLARAFIHDFDLNIKSTETLYVFFFTRSREPKKYLLHFGLIITTNMLFGIYQLVAIQILVQ